MVTFDQLSEKARGTPHVVPGDNGTTLSRAIRREMKPDLRGTCIQVMEKEQYSNTFFEIVTQSIYIQ